MPPETLAELGASDIRAGFLFPLLSTDGSSLPTGEETTVFSHCISKHAGHGGSVRDSSGDEEDGKDETMVPVDYETAGQIKDDVIFEEASARR